MDRLNKWTEGVRFKVQISRTFPLVAADEAHEVLRHNYLGRMLLTVGRGG